MIFFVFLAILPFYKISTFGIIIHPSFFNDQVNLEVWEKQVRLSEKDMKRCEWEKSLFFYCPYASVGFVDSTQIKRQTECCGEKCCTKKERENYVKDWQPHGCTDGWLQTASKTKRRRY